MGCLLGSFVNAIYVSGFRPNHGTHQVTTYLYRQGMVHIVRNPPFLFLNTHLRDPVKIKGLFKYHECTYAYRIVNRNRSNCALVVNKSKVEEGRNGA